MSFLEIVERAKAYLGRHRRMSLRALRREFDLDDEAVEDVVHELVHVQHIAVLDDKALVWDGPAVRQTAGAFAEEAASSPVSEAEHRQLTVMFYDLVGSTTLGQRLASGISRVR